MLLNLIFDKKYYRTAEDKLRWAFMMYDEDNSRMIDLKEMINVMEVKTRI